GHLHGAQRITESLRYSGSPLAYSFSEAHQRKSVWLVDLDGTGLAAVNRVELPVPRRLSTLRGTLPELLAAPEHDDLVEDYLSVTLTDRVRPLEPMRRLLERFPHAVHLEWEPEQGKDHRRLRYAEAVRGRTDEQVAALFLDDCRGSAPSDGERRLLAEGLLQVAGEGG
ncbi:MAG: exonuclease SbcCD subunit D, partial [Sciscionella sp.]